MADTDNTSSEPKKGFAAFQNPEPEEPETEEQETKDGGSQATDSQKKSDSSSLPPPPPPEAETGPDIKAMKGKTSIGIIGGPNAGKTIFLYALSKQMEKLGFGGDHMDGWTIGTFSKAYEIFCGKMAAQERSGDHQRTKVGISDFFDLFPMKKGNHEIMLRAFDAAGENFETAIDPAKFADLEKNQKDTQKYRVVKTLQQVLASCDAFVFLIDAELTLPFQQVGKKDILPPERLLSTLRNFLRRERGIPTGQNLDMPTAFVLTKSDTLPPEQEDIDYNDLKHTTPADCENFIRHYFNDVHVLTSQFPVRSFFAVTCLGTPPTYYASRPGTDEEKPVPVEKLSEMIHDGWSIRTDIGQLNPINVEKPLVFLAGSLMGKIDQTRKAARKRHLITAALITGLLILYPVLTFYAGIMLTKNKSLDLAHTAYTISAFHPLAALDGFKKNLAVKWLDLTRASALAGELTLASESITRFSRLGIQDAAMTSQYTDVVLEYARSLGTAGNHAQAFSLIQPLAATIDTTSALSSREKALVAELRNNLKTNITASLASENLTDAATYLAFAGQYPALELMAPDKINAAQYDIYCKKAKQALKTSDADQAGTALENALALYTPGASPSLKSLLQTIQKNTTALGSTRTLELFRQAVPHTRPAGPEQEIILATLLPPAIHAFSAGKPDQGLHHLKQILPLVAGAGTHPRILQVIQETAAPMEADTRIQFLDQCRQTLGNSQTLTKLMSGTYLEAATKHLEQGSPENAIKVLKSRPDVQTDPQTQKFLAHAALAKQMVFIQGSGTTRSFYLDPYEVTNQQYMQVAQKHRDLLPAKWGTTDYTSKSPSPDTPVIYITWHQARQFAEKIHKRLPSVKEWELAWQNRTYPWGNAFDPTRTNTRESRTGRTVTPDDPLYKKDRTSPGIHGLAGNAAEFTSDTMRDENRRLRAIVKGGSFVFFGKDISQSYNRKVIADQALPDIGFRCALDLLP